MATYEWREIDDAYGNCTSAPDLGGFTALIEAATVNATLELA